MLLFVVARYGREKVCSANGAKFKLFMIAYLFFRFVLTS